MNNMPTWISLDEKTKKNDLYEKILSLVENKDELKKLLNLSECRNCTGSCSGKGGCQSH